MILSLAWKRGKKKKKRNKALPEGKGPGEKDQAIFFFSFFPML